MSNNLIPVLTVDDKKYTQPTQNKGGLYVVNKEVLQGMPSNKFVFYNKSNGKYYHINAQTASSDYLKQIAEYEQRLQNIGRVQSNTANSTQVNSIADVASVLLSGDLFGAIGSTYDLVKNTVVDPIFSKDLKGQRAVTLVNNLFVNLGETLDYATGANAIKAFAQGGSIKDAYVWNKDTGRVQYDWNMETGAGGLTDFATNTFLEILSDPTNWITFGGKELIGNAIKNSVDNVAVKLNLKVNTQYLDNITKGLYNNFGNADALKAVDVRTLFNLPNVTSPAITDLINKTLKSSFEAQKAVKHADLINSVMGTSDFIEKSAFKAAVSTSALGLEGMAVVKAGREWMMPWVKSKLDNIFRYNKDIDTLLGYTKLEDMSKSLSETLNDMSGSYGLVPEEVADKATANMRAKVIKDLNEVANPVSRNIDDITKGLNEWAARNGFDSAESAYKFVARLYKEGHTAFKNIYNVLDEILHSTTRAIELRRLKAYDSAFYAIAEAETKIPFKGFEPDRVYAEDPIPAFKKAVTDLKKIREGLNKYVSDTENVQLIEHAVNRLVHIRVMDVVNYMFSIIYDQGNVISRDFAKSMHDYWRTIMESVDELGIVLPKEIVDIMDNLRSVSLIGLLRGSYNSAADIIDSIVDQLDSFYNNHVVNEDILARVEEAHKVITLQKENLAKRINSHKSYINLDYYKIAKDKYNGVNITSRALRKNLGKDYNKLKKTVGYNTYTTNDAFIYVTDSKNESTFNEVTLSAQDIVSAVRDLEGASKDVYTVKTINGIRNMLTGVINKYNLHDADEEIALIDRLFGNVSYRARTVKVTESDVKSLIDALRYRANSIRSELKDFIDQSVPNAFDPKKYRTGRIEIPKSVYDSVLSGSLTKADFNKGFGNFDKVYVDPADGKLYIDTSFTYPILNRKKRDESEERLSETYIIMETDINTLESVADNLDSYLEAISIEAGTLKVSFEQMQSKLYAPKMSQAAALDTLLKSPSVVEVFESILNSEGIGSIIRVLEENEETAEAAQYLHSLAVSTYVYGELTKAFRKKKTHITKEWADALVDSLAGIMRKHYSDIRLDRLTDELLQASKLFINKSSNNVVDVRLHKGGVLPKDQAKQIADILNNPDDPWHKLIEPELAEENKFNVVFSIGQASKSEGMFELVCMLPEELPGYGKEIHIMYAAPHYFSSYSKKRYAKEILGSESYTQNIRVQQTYDSGTQVIVTNNGVAMDYNPNAVLCDNENTFAIEVSKFLEALKEYVNPVGTKNPRTMRFIGFGNSIDYNKQNVVFNHFLRQNNLNFSLDNTVNSLYTAETLDIKAKVHASQGAVVITDELYKEVYDILKKQKAYLDEYNSKNVLVPANVMPDFSRDALSAMDTITKSISDALESRQPRVSRAYSESVANMLSSYPTQTLSDLQVKFKEFTDGVAVGMRQVKETNKTMGKEIIVDKVFKEFADTPNIMNYAKKYLVDGGKGGTLGVSFNLVHDPELMSEWFSLSRLDNTLFNNVRSMNSFVKRLQKTVDNITTTGYTLLYSEGSLRVDSEVVATLEEIIKRRSKSVVVHKNISYINKMKVLTPEQTYAVAVYYMSVFKSLGDNIQKLEYTRVLNKYNSDKDLQYYWGMAYKEHDTVLNKDGVYIPQIHSIKSVGFDESYDVYDALENHCLIKKLPEMAECLSDTLRFEDEFMDELGINADNIFKLKRPMYEAYVSFINDIKSIRDNAQREFEKYVSESSSAVERYEHKLMYTKKIKSITDRLNDLSVYRTYNRVYNILNMSVNDYEKYLYRYSQGIQLYDLNAEIFKEEAFAKLIADRARYINSAENKTALRSVQQDDYLIIYIDKSVDAKHLEALHKAAMGGNDAKGKYVPGINPHFTPLSLEQLPASLAANLEENIFFDKYVELERTIEHTHNVAYRLSMQRAMNEDRFDELLSYLSDDVKKNLIGKDYWKAYGLLQGGLSHTIVGDYKSGLGVVFKTYSGSLLTNLNSGFSKLYKQNVSKEAYITLLTSPVNSLKDRLDIFNSVLPEKLTVKEIRGALDEHGYKVISFNGRDVTNYVLRTEDDLKNALDNNAILIDSDLYDKVLRVLRNNDLPKWLTNSKIFQYMHLLKLGQLMSPGWVIRNIFDSTVKGAIQANANIIDYVTMIPAVRKKLKEFDKILSTVHEVYGKATLDNAAKFFDEYPGMAVEFSMTKEAFLDYYKFSMDSASVPTPAQLNIFNNIKGKLTRLLTNNKDITESHIDSLLKLYKENQGNFVLVKERLTLLYPDNVVEALLSVFNEIPEGFAKLQGSNIYATITTWLTEENPIVRMNNDVERIQRFLAYDYNRIMGKTTGAAIDAVNASQFNRSHDTLFRRLFEVLLPFSSFQIDNTLFWLDALSSASGSVVGVLTDYLQAHYNEEELTPEEIATNASIQYMFMQGNIMLDYDGSLTLKTSDSLFNTMNVLADPVGYLKDAFNVPMEKVVEFIKALNQDEEEYKKDPYGKVKPLSMWDESETLYLWNNKDYGLQVNNAVSFAAELIPVIGAWWLRAQTAWTDPVTDPLSTVLRCVAPSLFGKTKRTGYDWYGANNNDEYHKTHSFVPGISYIPSWLKTDDPKTYANTIQRLKNMGYDNDTAVKMVSDWGYYIKAPDYALRQYRHSTPKIKPVRTVFPKKVYAPRAMYTKKVYSKKTYPRTAKMISGGDRYRTTRFGVARIYRLTSMYDRITKSGTSRMTMMLGRGHGASSIRVVRDRIKNNTIRRQRQRRILHM